MRPLPFLEEKTLPLLCETFFKFLFLDKHNSQDKFEQFQRCFLVEDENPKYTKQFCREQEKKSQINL